MNATEKTTHVDLVKLQTQTNQQLIQALFDLNDLQYGELVYNTGLDYARRMTDNDDFGFEFLIKTRFYWQWWKNEWAKRDANFLEVYCGVANKAALYDQYLFQHNIQRLHNDALMSKKTVSMVGFAMDEYLKEYRKELAK